MKITAYNYTLNRIQMLILLLGVLTIVQLPAEELLNLHKNHSLVGSHGMVLMHHEKEGFFVSHLPLYSHPHNFQIIYKVQINQSNKTIDLLENGMVTVLPVNFDLSKLVKGESFSIFATFYQGHFERGGEPKFTADLLFDEAVLIKKVKPKFNSTSSIIYTVPISNQLKVFAHKVQQAPSFDAIGFIESAEQEKNNHLNESGVKLLTCEKATILTTKLITKSLEACQKFNIKYIETKDFS